ncbi:bactericidal permeability-increasing protein-like [Acanthopagrus latus]|uniref:bactericidal permeability-increasing protein-like n=1 Tax=Acanthopagrus latus TaxID=8177 RepID=UPI00187CF33A|nr:bactericidal permeability-increasing protein-like [Acanthopagrus latus]XP_036957424.1 bactericidal permeability-increasing protein-like [Acanthopagrus latus]
MSLYCWLALVALVPMTLSTEPGVKVRLTAKGLEYGRQLGMAALQEKLKAIRIPDFSGKERVSGIGKVRYSLSNINIKSVGLPTSAVTLVAGTGVKMSITGAFISLHGNWRVKYLFIRDSGSFDLDVRDLSISATIAVGRDATGHPTVSSADCAANVGSARVKFHGGGSWLYNLFSKYINRALQRAMEKQICPLVTKAVSDMNPRLQTLNVLAKVDKHAEIEYSMVSPPAVSASAIDLNLKGEFYNIGNHQEPPFSPKAISLPPQVSNMVYISLSAFTANSAGFVYNRAGILTQDVTDDMIPRLSPIRLNTRTFGVFIPEIARRFPGLMMKLVVRTSKDPFVSFEPNSMTVNATGTVTAYAIQPNATLTSLFVLNLETSVSAQVFLSGMRLAGAVNLNRFDLTLGTSSVGQFRVKSLDSIFEMVLKVVVIPVLNVQLAKGYPLPALRNMNLLNTQLQILKDNILIATDVQFTG